MQHSTLKVLAYIIPLDAATTSFAGFSFLFWPVHQEI